jgi:hypothetical protein
MPMMLCRNYLRASTSMAFTAEQPCAVLKIVRNTAIRGQKIAAINLDG